MFGTAGEESSTEIVVESFVVVISSKDKVRQGPAGGLVMQQSLLIILAKP